VQGVVASCQAIIYDLPSCRQEQSELGAARPPGVPTNNPRIKSLSGGGPPGFVDVRAAGQPTRAYPGEQSRTGVNCNPDCNPVRDTWSSSDHRVRRLGHSGGFRAGTADASGSRADATPRERRVFGSHRGSSFHLSSGENDVIVANGHGAVAMASIRCLGVGGVLVP
jgi:hypothetical protein